ncbi:hypothetical protein SCP_1800440 [Sparassis crispa]|uniref:Uncharacterized protein n=1 Tax=Sparassis crispa TaxID=139825 RepID=A0A401H6H6_9APHY|nr:hypothetical protein SCP_1800440 [Sparassis crispa]GBE90022.1 hypothetical protein SCP_1800440 [Sparassis crispa]
MEGEPSTEEPQAGPSSSTSSRPSPSDDEGEHDLLSDVSPRGPVQLPPSPMPSDDSSALTSVHYTAARDSDSGTSGRSNPAPAIPDPSPSHVCSPVSVNATVTWELAPALWQFDVLLAPFQFDLDLQPLSLNDTLLRMQWDDANKLTGAFNLTFSAHAAVPFSLDSSSETSLGVPLRASSSNMHTSSPSPSVSVLSARSPSALSPSALSPHVPSPPTPSPSVPSLPAPSHSMPSPLIPSRSAPSLTLTPSGPSMPISSVCAPSTSMPSLPRSSASGVPAPSVLVCPEPVDVSLSALTSVSSSTCGCCRVPQKQHVHEIPVAMEASPAASEGPSATRSSHPARTRVAPKQADVYWSRSGKQQPIVATGQDTEVPARGGKRSAGRQCR